MRGEKRPPPTEWEREVAAPETSSSSAAAAAAAAKRPKVPALTGVIVEALKMDGLQRLCSTLEPLLRRIVSEEVERALTKLSCAKLTGRSSPQRIDGPGGRKLQLHFRSRMPPHLFTGGKVEGERGAAIHVVLLDANTGMIVSGPESMAKLNVVVLEGDFNDEADDDWSQEHFESYEVKEREGKRPLLTGDLQVTLKEGVGTLGELIFTDNSSWIRSRKFRLGLKLADGYCDGIRIREAKTEAFTVKDHRGELYKKHYPPALHDEVWRLDRIAKDGALHRKLVNANILTVEDFLQFLVRDPQRLRNILGSAVSNRMWENTVEHAKTCVLSGKLYVYYSDEIRSSGAVFNHIYELRGLISNGKFLSVESLSHDQKVSVDLLVKRAYDDWNHAIEYDGQDLLNSEKSSQKAQHPPTTVYNSPLGHRFVPMAHPEGYHSSSTGTCLQNEGAHSDLSALLALETPQTSYGGACTSGDWPHVQEEQNFDHYMEEIRIRSSEILEHGDMQCLLSSFSTGGVGGFGSSGEAHYSYPSAHFEPQSEFMFGQEHNRNNAKAAISWLKLKAAFRWGIFIRKKAAERRAQLVELD
ncbi:calmodulin-binding protein 60 E-like isoform X2 [Phoenix dactylifera]|uniref:Calmodulin-binding protein 60 E-like isoform X2 n=1 Tax=Phoenix dactylifera TaxID=42345 RepID=A0A8B8ZCZ5_PHODC|nr:calmodulin-binding protein 60 E-like isoform X2 [Phoenix dactylifera]